MQNSKLKKNFRFLPDIATADLAFEAFGKTPSELFENAGRALEEAMVSPETVEPTKKYTINKEEESLEELFFVFLEELVFLKDADQMVFSKIECKVVQMENGKWKMETQVYGEAIDLGKHKLGDDVKAITKHLFEVKQLPNKTFRCQVILDV